MTQLFSFTISRTEEIDILDCGAGQGMLSFSLLNMLIKKGYTQFRLTLYEIDNSVLSKLNDNLKRYQKQHPQIKLSFKVLEKDFILDPIDQKFDYIISNPPYFKLKKDAPQAKHMNYIIHGQPNIYMLFMEKSAQLLKKMVKWFSLLLEVLHLVLILKNLENISLKKYC